MPASCRFHCSACGRHFTSLIAFDRHRDGPYDARVCVEPESRPERLRALGEGMCRIGGGQQMSGVPVWGVRMSPAARERLRRLSERSRTAPPG